MKRKINKIYFKNRFLRIYSALIIYTFLSVLNVYSTGYFNLINVKFINIITWIFCQISFIQFTIRIFMRAYGTVILNGSLWKIYHGIL